MIEVTTMTNFDFLLSMTEFGAFAEAAVAAERIYAIDAAACVLNCRKAMELAVKWVYTAESGLDPYQSKLAVMINSTEFRNIVGVDIWQRLDYIRVKGNDAAHSSAKITEAQAMLCLENLFVFLDFVAYCYGTELYTERDFDASLPGAQDVTAPADVPEVDIDALIEENRALRDQLTARREVQQQTYVPKPVEHSEAETRRLYIDAMLTDAGWIEGRNWINEVEVDGMPNQTGKGHVDYVLYDDMHRPLAIIEA